MAEVIGRLITDLHPNGKVRMVFLASVGGGFEKPQMANNLDIAEGEFANTLGLTPERAAELRAQLEREKVADAVIGIDAEVASTFRNQPLRKD
jgi:hypothetical protein